MRRDNQGRQETHSVSMEEQQALIEALSAALLKNSQAGPISSAAASDEYDSSIDLMELFYHVLSKIRYVIAAALIGAILAGIYAVAFVTPVYKATSKLYIMSQDNVAVSLQDFQIGNLLTLDYQEVFKTWEVHEMVRTELNLNYTYSQMQKMLTVSNPDDTRLLYITVSNTDPQLASDIANAYGRAAKAFITQTMDAREPNMFSIALVPSQASSMGKSRYVAMGFVAGTVLSLGVIFLLFVLDDRPRTPDDIRKIAGIPTLAVVPNDEKVRQKSKVKREVKK